MVEGVSYVYKVKGAADETYSATKPVTPGEYTVRASFPAVTNYQAVTATADFTVSHVWADTWSTDETGHWHECTGCGEKKDAAGHVYGSDQDVICAACGYDRTVTENQTKGEVEVKPGTGTPAVTTDNVTSEIDGKVIMVNVREGETPRSGMTAVAVYNLDNMEITANIDELDIGNIQMGMEVRIVRSGTDRVSFSGTVSAISYEATNSNGVAYFPITITIPAKGELSAGVNVSYYIDVGDTEEGVLAPLEALKSYEGGTCLYVKAEKRPEDALVLDEGVVPDGFYAVPVEVGATNSRYARILSGVERDVEVFTRYQLSAPTGGDTTSQGGDEEFRFPSDGFDGGFPGGGSGMPGFSGGGMPGGMGGRP